MTGAWGRTLIRRAEWVRDREALRLLTAEYLAWVAERVQDQVDPAATFDAADELTERLCALAPPAGAFYLVEHDGEAAGMGGWRLLTPGVAEFKRIYLRPACRGLSLGPTLVQRLMVDARACGCAQAALDTAPFMHAAQRLYAAAGFVDCPPYAGTEVPAAWHDRWRFMMRQL